MAASKSAWCKQAWKSLVAGEVSLNELPTGCPTETPDTCNKEKKITCTRRQHLQRESPNLSLILFVWARPTRLWVISFFDSPVRRQLQGGSSWPRLLVLKDSFPRAPVIPILRCRTVVSRKEVSSYAVEMESGTGCILSPPPFSPRTRIKGSVWRFVLLAEGGIRRWYLSTSLSPTLFSRYISASYRMLVQVMWGHE